MKSVWRNWFRKISRFLSPTTTKKHKAVRLWHCSPIFVHARQFRVGRAHLEHNDCRCFVGSQEHLVGQSEHLHRLKTGYVSNIIYSCSIPSVALLFLLKSQCRMIYWFYCRGIVVWWHETASNIFLEWMSTVFFRNYVYYWSNHCKTTYIGRVESSSKRLN